MGPYPIQGIQEENLSMKRLFKKICNHHISKIDIFLHPINQNKHLKLVS